MLPCLAAEPTPSGTTLSASVEPAAPSDHATETVTVQALGNTLAAAGIPAASATGNSASAAALTESPLKTRPEGLEVKTGGDRIVLAWEPYAATEPGSRISYRLYRSETPLPPAFSPEWPKPIHRQPLQQEFYLDSAATSHEAPKPKVHYYYALIAVDDKDRASPPAFIHAVNIPELSAPTNVHAKPGDCQVALSWTPAFSGGEAGVDGYMVFRSPEAGRPGRPLVAKPLDQPQFLDQGGPDSPLINGKEYYYTVFTQDASGKRSGPSEQIAVMPCRIAGAPGEVTATGKSDDMIELTWAAPAPGTFPTAGYNIYRATDNDKLEGPINRGLVTGTRFTDAESTSTSKPILGRVYQYVVRPVDEKGLEGASSATVTASALPPLEIPRSGLLSTAIPGLPPDSTLTISGRKKIDIGYTEVFPLNTTPGGPSERYPSLTSGLTKGFNLAQELQVRLEGKVGKKITVDVDYDDTKEEQRKISILYNGEPDEVVQEAAFGDILLDLPHTEFAGYNKNLFGAKLRVGLDRFRFYAIGAQTKGITVTEKFKGNTALRTIDVQDVDFVAFKYYYLTKDWPNQVNHPDLNHFDKSAPTHGIVPGSVELYVTDGVVTADTVTVTANARQLRFNRQSPGIDYTVDFERGIVTFTRTIDRTWTILAAYKYRDSAGVEHSVGYNPDGTVDFDPTHMQLPTNGITSDAAHLIQDTYSVPGAFSMMLMNRYSLGYQNIFDPQSDPDFVIKIFTTGGQEISLPQPSDAVKSEEIYKIDPTFGTIQFRYDYPFAKNYTTEIFKNPEYNFLDPNLPNDSYNPGLNSRLGGTSVSNLANNYRIHVEYKNTITTFKLANWNVLKNSEVIKKDGLKLQRNTDYYIDYESGFLTFLNPGSISANTEITVTYEYMPFGGKFQNNIFGARAEYELWERKLTVGSTFLYNASQTPLEIPDVRSTPSSLSLIDADFKLSLNPEDFGVWTLPLLGAFRLPLTLQVAGEGAYSEYTPNTYRKSGEGGVAMIDGMEGSDNVVSLSVDNNAWFPASAPHMYPLTPGLDTDQRRFSALSDVFDYGRTWIDANDKKHMLHWSYSNLTNQSWDGFVYPVASSGTNLHDYRFLEISAKVDQPVVLMVDIGIVSEDANHNGRLNFEGDRIHLSTGDDVGVANYIASLDPNTKQPNIAPDPDGPWGRYTSTPSDYPNYQPQYDDPNSGDYRRNVRNYWGGFNGRLNNEDLDANDQLDTQESVYQYKITLQPGFKLYKIPLTVIDNIASATTGELPPTADPNNLQFLAMVKHVRLWVTGASGVPVSDAITIESVQLTGNKWQVRVAPNTVDTNGSPVSEASVNTMNASTISKETDPDVYESNPFFFNYDTTNAEEELKSERALKLEYQLDRHAVVNPLDAGNTQPAFYISRNLGSSSMGDYDYSGYQNLHFDVYKQTPTLPGEQIFLRIGLDSSNYYEYRVSLDDAPLNSWHTYKIDLNDPNRGVNFQRGTIPTLSQVREISLGVWNPNDTGQKEVLWINNLRLANPEIRKGLAMVMNTDAKVGDILSVKSTYRDTNSDFLTIDESPKGKQHQIQSQVTTTINKWASFLPITLSWNRRASFTDLGHRDDPAFSSNYSLADNSMETLSGDIGFTRIPGLDITLNAQKTYKDIAYIQQLSTPNSQEWIGSLTPSVSYTLPDKLFNWPIGTSTLTGKMTYSDNHTVYDAYGTSVLGRTDMWDKWKHSIEENYSYQGSYRPFAFLNISPNFTYAQNRERGFLSLYRYYADLNPAITPDNPRYFSDVFKTSRVNKVAGLNINLMTLPVISPTLTYNGRNTRDYIQNTLEVSKDFNARTNVTFNELLGWAQCPQFTLDHKYLESASYRNDREGVDNIGNLDFDTLWLGDPIDYKKLNAKVDEQSYLNSKNLTETISTNIALIPDVNLSPQYSTSWVRRMNSPGNFNTTETMSVGSGLLWSKIPSFDWLVLQSLNVDYRYSANKNFDTNNVENSRNTTHNTNVTLPFKLSSDLNGSVNMTSDNTVRLSGQNLNVKYFENQYTGDLTLNYKLRMLDPIRLPNIWPFYGALIKIEQTLLLTNKLSAAIVRNTAQNVAGADKSTDTWTNETTLNYSLWKNVEGNFKMTNQYFRDNINVNKDYWAISLKFGLSAVF